jgi:hypothetical protein
MIEQQSPTTVGDALIAEIARVRDEVMPVYVSIGPPGRFALAMMGVDIDAATRALAEGDAVACIRLLESLRGFHT